MASTVLISIIALLVGRYFLRSFKESGLCLSVVWCSYAIEQLLQARFPWFSSNGSAFNFGIAAFVSLIVLYLLAGGKIKWANLTTTAACYYLMIGWCSLSFLWSIAPGETEQNLTSALPYIGVFAILSPFLIRSPKDLLASSNGTILLGVFVMLGHAQLELSGFRGRSIQIQSLSGLDQALNPLAVASFGGFVTICTSFWIYQNRKAKLIRLLVAGVIIALGLYTIVRSGSRGQLLAVVAALLIWVPITAQVALKRQSIIALLTAAGIAFGSIQMIGVLGWSGNWEKDRIQNSFSGRLSSARGALSEFASGDPIQWVVGQGSSSSWKSLGGYPHNVPAEILLEQGVIGFLLFTIFVLSVVFAGMKILLDKRVDQSSRLVLGLILCLFTFEGVLLFKQGSFLGSTGFFGTGIAASIVLKQLRRSQMLLKQKAWSEKNLQHQFFLHQYSQNQVR